MTDYTNKCGSCIHFRPNGKRKIGNCQFKQELSGKIYTYAAGRKACGNYEGNGLRNTSEYNTKYNPTPILTHNDCGYLDRNGICQCDKTYIHVTHLIHCADVKRCTAYINTRELTKKHNRAANDRPVTPLTRRLIYNYYKDGDSILLIAISLNRSTAVIERILKDESISSL